MTIKQEEQPRNNPRFTVVSTLQCAECGNKKLTVDLYTTHVDAKADILAVTCTCGYMTEIAKVDKRIDSTCLQVAKLGRIYQ